MRNCRNTRSHGQHVGLLTSPQKSFVGSRFQLEALTTGQAVICGMSEDNLFSSLSWSSDWEQAAYSLVVTGSGGPSEEEESHFVMSFLPQIGSGGQGRRGSGTVADTVVWWGIKIPCVRGEHHKYDNASLLQCSALSALALKFTLRSQCTVTQSEWTEFYTADKSGRTWSFRGIELNESFIIYYIRSHWAILANYWTNCPQFLSETTSKYYTG